MTSHPSSIINHSNPNVTPPFPETPTRFEPTHRIIHPILVPKNLVTTFFDGPFKRPLPPKNIIPIFTPPPTQKYTAQMVSKDFNPFEPKLMFSDNSGLKIIQSYFHGQVKPDDPLDFPPLSANQKPPKINPAEAAKIYIQPETTNQWNLASQMKKMVNIRTRIFLRDKSISLRVFILSINLGYWPEETHNERNRQERSGSRKRRGS